MQTSPKGWFYLKQDNDTFRLYALSSNGCDTVTRGIKYFPIVQKNGDTLKVKTTNESIESVISYGDSLLFFQESFKDTYYHLTGDDAEKMEKSFSNYKPSLPAYFRDNISFQENEIYKLSAEVKLSDHALQTINFIDKSKRQIISMLLDIEYNRSINWCDISGLGELAIKPNDNGLSKTMIQGITLSKEIFNDYLTVMNFPEGKRPYLVGSRLFEEPEKTYITTGEVIIFYNDLILEIYRIEMLSS